MFSTFSSNISIKHERQTGVLPEARTPVRRMKFKKFCQVILKCPLNKPHCGLFRRQELHNFIESVLFHRFYEMQTLQQCNKAYFRRSEAAFL